MRSEARSWVSRTAARFKVGGARLGGRDGTPRIVDGGVHLHQRDGGFLGIDRLHAAARLFEPDDGLLKRNQGRHFGIQPRLVGELPLFAPQPLAEKQVIDLAGLAEAVET